MSIGETSLPKFRDVETRRREGLAPRRARSLPRLVGQALLLVYRADRPRAIGMAVLSLVTAGLAAVQVLAAQAVLEGLLRIEREDGGTSDVLLPLLLMVGTSVAAATVTAVQGQQQRFLSEEVQQASTMHLVQACAKMPLVRFETPAFFDQLQRVQTAALTRPFAVATGITNLMSGAAGAVAVTIVLVGIAPALVPVLVLGGVPALLLSRYASRTEFAFSVDQSSRQRLRMYLQMLLVNRETAKEIRAFGSSDLLTTRWATTTNAYLKALRLQVRKRTWLAAASSLLTGVVGLVAVLLLVWMLTSGQVDLAAAGAALAGVRLLGSRVQSITIGTGSLFESAIFLQDLDEFVTMEHEESSAASLPEAPKHVTEIRGQDLHFRYPEASADTLKGVDLVINRGEVVALVGENGSGKTTLAKVLAALYAPTGGRITWDGVDIAGLDPTSCRRSIAVVFQDFIKYALPASENIGLGKPDSVDDLPAIIAAARRSGADDVIRRLPEGYDTYLGGAYSGQDISVGQWQRMALARAFFRDAPFVILDEPSAALDPRAEHDLFFRVRDLLAGRTVLLISHRFSSVRNADRIYVMDRGSILEHGSHDELMARGGRYSELFTLQAAAYLGGETATSA